MLLEIFKKLDRWIIQENEKARDEGARLIAHAEFKILGQAALLEAQLSLELAQTGDVDAYTNATHLVLHHLDELLFGYGMHLDKLSDEIWMPEETTYSSVYKGEYIEMLIAVPEYVLVSKALKAPRKNAGVIVQYLAAGPSPFFFNLCDKYEVDLEQFLHEEEDD